MFNNLSVKWIELKALQSKDEDILMKFCDLDLIIW